jgi:hypothetical protein
VFEEAAMHVLAVVAATWVALMTLLVARARRGRTRPEASAQREDAPAEG